MNPSWSAFGASSPEGRRQRPGDVGSAAAVWPGQRSAQAAAMGLEALFRHIAAQRMDGVPILHPDLLVQALGFEVEPDGAVAVGVLITPWFMNLVRLPLAADVPMAAPGDSALRVVGRERFSFIGAEEPGFGAYEACSLFSPMFEFVDHEAARATADAVLAELRRIDEPAPAPALPDASRRAWLLGRSHEDPAR
jgi:[NiFe] hydrogenase assembly HybE family chaperone